MQHSFKWSAKDTSSAELGLITTDLEDGVY